MIEGMLNEIKRRLPLEIKEAELIGDVLNFHGENWGSSIMCGWRLISFKKVIKGSRDDDIGKFVEELKGLTIVDVTYQEDTLIIDPVFILSSGEMIEVFSTDNFEPWTFCIEDKDIYFYSATPGEPDTFEK